MSFADRFEQSAVAGRAITFVSADQAERVPYAELFDDARAVGSWLVDRGIGPGSRIALLGPTSRPLVTCIEAAWLVGAAVVVLPMPMRFASIEALVAQTRARIRNADCALVLLAPELEAFFVPEPDDPPTESLAAVVDLPRRLADRFTPAAGDPDRLAILQYTSGSTSDPKGVMLTERCLTTNLDAIRKAMGADPERDSGVSWLPLYHDMGLIGGLGTALSHGGEFTLMDPRDFLASPSSWLRLVSEKRATISPAPNFAYALAARTLRRETLDLSQWRVALNGAEPIDIDTVQSFCAAASDSGFDANAMCCVYGLAEATLAVTFRQPNTGLGIDVVDRDGLERGGEARPVPGGGEGTRPLVRLGGPVQGVEVRIVDEAFATVGERTVGEIEVKGASVSPGYFRQPEATAESRNGEWLRTGDSGYMADGELVVVGRIRDLIIVGGRNILPEDVERAVARVAGVRAGNVVAFGVRKGPTESLVVAAETRSDEPPRLRREISQRVADEVGVVPIDVVLLAPTTLPKTSSGKLQRGLSRERYLAGSLQ